MLIVSTVPAERKNLTKPEFTSGSTLSRIQERGHLRVAINFEIPGFCHAETRDGRIRGFEVDLAAVLAQQIFGGEPQQAQKYIEFIPVELHERDDYALDPHAADVVLGNYADTPKRREFMDFAGHYLFSPQAALMSAQGPDVVKSVDLNELCITAVSGTADADTLGLVAPSAEISERKTVTECMQALVEGKVQAFWASIAFNAVQVKEHSELFKSAPVRHGGERWGFGLRKGDDDFRKFIDSAVSASFASGDLNGSLRRWLG